MNKSNDKIKTETGENSKALSLYRPYGWRGQIGLICPSTNTSIEEVIITASGGPFLKLPLENLKK